MTLYIVQGRGSGTTRQIWVPGDPGQPNHADTREELISSCPPPDSLPCPAVACDNASWIWPRKDRRERHPDRDNWQWARMRFCRRCQGLRNHHGLTLIELIGIWEAQDRKCFKCSKELPDPRIMVTGIPGKGRQAQIDHDHRICPKASHSCERCRRGLVCIACNTHSLALRTVGLWVLPEAPAELVQWLEFLGPTDRDRLRQALILFPEQPIRRVRRPRSEPVPQEAGATLFDLDGYRLPASG